MSFPRDLAGRKGSQVHQLDLRHVSLTQSSVAKKGGGGETTLLFRYHRDIRKRVSLEVESEEPLFQVNFGKRIKALSLEPQPHPDSQFSCNFRGDLS